MMIRIAQPCERRKQRALLKPRRHPPYDLAEQQAVREHRQVMPVLLERSHWDDHRRVFR